MCTPPPEHNRRPEIHVYAPYSVVWNSPTALKPSDANVSRAFAFPSRRSHVVASRPRRLQNATRTVVGPFGPERLVSSVSSANDPRLDPGRSRCTSRGVFVVTCAYFADVLFACQYPRRRARVVGSGPREQTRVDKKTYITRCNSRSFRPSPRERTTPRRRRRRRAVSSAGRNENDTRHKTASFPDRCDVDRGTRPFPSPPRPRRCRTNTHTACADVPVSGLFNPGIRQWNSRARACVRVERTKIRFEKVLGLFGKRI